MALASVRQLPKRGTSQNDTIIRTLPNGVSDQIVNGDYVQRVAIKPLQASDIITIYTTSTNVALARVTKSAIGMISNTSAGTCLVDGMQEYTQTAGYDDVANIGKFATTLSSFYLDFIFAKGTTLAQAQQALAGKTLTYQLANPIVTPITPRSVKPNVKNLVKNGNFANDTTGWNNHTNVTSRSVANNILSFTAGNNTSTASLYQDTGVPLVQGHKIYAGFKARVTNAVAQAIQLQGYNTGFGSFLGYFANISSPAQNVFYQRAGILTVGAGITGNLVIYPRQNYVDAATTTGKTMEIKELLAIDLTDTFGAGKEPDLATCDKLFAKWFDGEKYMPELANPQMIPKKNLFPTPKGSLNCSGVAITANADGSVTLNGTATLAFAVGLTGILWSSYGYAALASASSKILQILNGNHTLSMSSISGYCSKPEVAWVGVSKLSGESALVCNALGNKSSNLIGYPLSYGWFYTPTGTVFNNFTFKLQLEEGSTATPYEPYISVNKPALR